MNRALLTLALASACNMNVMVDPEGHRCNELDPCPSGYSCVNFECHGEGGGSAGGSVGGGVMGGGEVGGGDPGGGSAGGVSDGGCNCAVLPPGTCMGTVARSFTAPATCQAGQCQFTPFDLDCAPGTCSNGICSLSVSQIGPRLRFAINAVDLAPTTNATTALAIGERSQVAAWNGSRWASVQAPTSNLSLKAVNFTSATMAWVVGEQRTVWRWDKGTGAFVNTPAPGLSGSATLIGVDGTSDTSVLVADSTGNWSQWNGTGWTDGGLPTTNASAFSMTSLYVDETQRQRLAGLCTNGTGQRRVCIGYRNFGGGGNWLVDTGTDTRGCISLGPSLDVPVTLGPDAVCGFSDNESVRHSYSGTFSTNALSLLQGSGLVGITGGPPDAGQRPLWALTSSSGGNGRLYRVTGTNASPLATAALDTTFGEEHLSPSESSGVLVAEVDRARNVNNVFYRRLSPVERTDALDLGFDIVGVTSLSNELTLVGSAGELAIQHTGSDVFEFRRAPSGSPQYRLEDVEGRNGTGLLAVGRDGLGAGLIGRIGLAAYTRLTTNATSTTFKGVCRASDQEAFAVGTGGAVFAIAATAATREAVTVTADLSAIDCPVVGEAVACGASSTVLRRTQGAWSVLPFPLPGKTFTTCRLVNGSLWVAGDGVFARLDRGAAAWTLLPARAGLAHLMVRAPNDVLATSASSSAAFEIVRFDGTSWSTAAGPYPGASLGVGQILNRFVWGGSAGVLIEGR